MKQLVITLIGPDRAGLVDQISNIIYDHQASWQASSLSNLAGMFAGIILIQVSDNLVTPLRDALSEINGLDVVINEGEKSPESQVMQHHQLSVTGNDRPGIVKEVSQALASFGININKMETHAQSAANAGTMIFNAQFHLDIPESLSLNDLREKLESLSDDLMVEFDNNESQ
ncbi:glycine cleavage system protein R [Veronia pacifica]|uniref:Glycine cleavage system transcriptional repressor n=1 Tax=Veronia pacifica TaxID=1080227 RepID=A0A1C3EGE3_9GAMM|nr:ACT domain-containing protein [Veronia pacifica]ODA32289.1 amino acid-binding protein [Veronia pacifica]